MARTKKPLKKIPRPTESEVNEILQRCGFYIHKGMELEDDLIKTGWQAEPGESPGEPDWPGKLSDLSTQEIKDSYDMYLAWYNYLSNEVGRVAVKIRTAKEWAKLVEAEVNLVSNTLSELSNAEIRKSWMLTHPAYMHARSEFIYFKTRYEEQEARIAKCKKNMSRLNRELWDRSQKKDGDVALFSADEIEESAAAKHRHFFKKLKND